MIEPCWMCGGVERHTRECAPPLGRRDDGPDPEEVTF